jgi:4-amino-4-deoxy-L-arabinose transferase-like glycosyltransferase
MVFDNFILDKIDFLILIFFVLAIFPIVAFLLFDNGIYPSDPIFMHLKVRFILVTGSFIQELNETSRGYAMSYPLGLEYILASLSTIDFTYSYYVIRVFGPLLTVLTVILIYKFLKEIFRDKATYLSVFMLVGAARLWIWYRKMTLANGVSELFSIYSLLCLNSYIEKKDSKCFTEFLIITAASWLIHPPMAIMYSILPYTFFILFYNKENLKKKFVSMIKIFIFFFLLTFPFWIFINANTILWRAGLAPEVAEHLQFNNPPKVHFANLLSNVLTAWSGWNLPVFYGVIPVLSGCVALFIALKQKKYKILNLLALITIFQFIYYFTFIEPFSTILDWTYSKQRMLLHTQFNFILLIPFVVFYLSKKLLNRKTLFLFVSYLILVAQLLINYYGIYTAGELFYTYRGYNIDLDYISLLDYLDKNLGFNTTVLIDDMETVSFESLLKNVTIEKPWIKTYTAILWEATYQHFISTEFNERYSPDRTRSFTWIAISRLYPRIVEGNDKLLDELLRLKNSTKSWIRFFNTNRSLVLIIHNKNLIDVAKNYAEINECPYIFWNNKYFVIFIAKN